MGSSWIAGTHADKARAALTEVGGVAAVYLTRRNRPEWRVRSGDYHVLHRIGDAVLTEIIVDAGHRREIFR